MQIATDSPQASTAIRTDLDAIFVSMELSRSIWLITSLLPGSGEKLSKHVVRAGDITGLLARTGRSFPIIVIQEAGLDRFWIHRVLRRSDRRRGAGPGLAGPQAGEPRVCAMVRVPTPEEEDRRRICRERKVLIADRIRHANRVKGLLFAQG